MRLAGAIVVGLAAACGTPQGPFRDAAAVSDAPFDAPRARSDGSIADASGDTRFSLDAAIASGAWFEEIGASAGLDFFRVPTEGYETFPDRFSGGVCVLDLDSVAPPELFFAMRDRSTLYVGDSPRHWEEASAIWGLTDVGDAIGCLAFDADGDDRDDLLVTGVGSVRLFLQREGGFVLAGDAFADVFEAGVMYASAAAGDVDGDGDLDLLVAGFLDASFSVDPGRRCGSVPCTADINTYPAAPNLLLLRDSEGRYDEAGELAPELRFAEPTLVVAIGDFMEDGAPPELFIGNDLGGWFVDRLLARDGDEFIDVARPAGFATNYRGYGIDTMGFASLDIDNDGRLEHVETSFEGDASAVFDCATPGICEDRSNHYGTAVRDTSFRWAPVGLDVNLDGWIDLVEATGHYYEPDEITAIGYDGPTRQPPNFYLNLGGVLSAFSPAEESPLSLRGEARGAARLDIDEDGRPDLIFAPARGAPMVLRNVRESSGRWLSIVLRGRTPNTRAVGARVTLQTVLGTQAAEVRAGDGYLGNSERALLFGLGEVEEARVVIRWPSGSTTMRSLANAELDAKLVLRE